MYNQPQNQRVQNLSKPKILIALLVFVILQLCLIITVLVLQAVWTFIGFQKATQKININGSCTTTYLNLKYSNTLIQYPMSIAFVLTCSATLFTIVLMALVIKPFVIKSQENPILYRQASVQERSFLAILLIHLGVNLSRVWYLLQSLIVMMVAVNFGYYLSYYIQIPVSCYSQTVKDQILIITILSGVALLFGLVSWIIILCINQSLQKAANELLNDYKYEDNSYRSDKKQGKNKEIEMQKVSQKKSSKRSHKDQKDQLQSGRNINPIIINQNKELFLDKNSERSDKYQYKTPQYKRTNSKQPEENVEQQFRRSVIRDNNSKYASRKDIYETPYSRIHSNKYYQPEDSPKQSYRKNEGLIVHRESRFDNSPSKYKLREEESNYIRSSNNNRILPTEGEVYEGNRNRLHSTYFRNDQSIPKAKYGKSSTKKKGILTDYIHGEYKR